MLIMGASRIFSRVGKLGGLSGDKSPPAGSRGRVWWGSGGFAPRSRRKIV